MKYDSKKYTSMKLGGRRKNVEEGVGDNIGNVF